MGCPKHLQWSPIKEEPVAEELVEPSQKQNRGSLSSLGLKGKRRRKRGFFSFSSAPSFSNILSPRVSFCKCCSKVFFLIGMM